MDRNYIIKITGITPTASLSARRAWIEISRAETAKTSNTESLSARRAWIEIIDYIIDYVNDAVALRKESVDRNSKIAKKVLTSLCRSPQGERG